MENLIEFQEIQNQNIEILKQQLQDLNVSNNTEEEIMTTKYKKKPRKSKKIVLSSSDDSSDKENKEPIEKPKVKRERTDKQKEAFIKAREKMMANAELRKLERAKNAEKQKQDLEEKIIKKAILLKKKEIKKKAILEEISSDSTEDEKIKKIVKKLNKKKEKEIQIQKPEPEESKFKFII